MRNRAIAMQWVSSRRLFSRQLSSRQLISWRAVRPCSFVAPAPPLSSNCLAMLVCSATIAQNNASSVAGTLFSNSSCTTSSCPYLQAIANPNINSSWIDTKKFEPGALDRLTSTSINPQAQAAWIGDLHSRNLFLLWRITWRQALGRISIQFMKQELIFASGMNFAYNFPRELGPLFSDARIQCNAQCNTE